MAKSPAPVSEWQPEAFCLSLGMRRSRSAWLLSKGTRRSVRKRRTSLRRSRSRRMRLQAGGNYSGPLSKQQATRVSWMPCLNRIP